MKSHKSKKIHFIVMHFLLKPKLVACNDLIPTSKHCSTLCKLRERERELHFSTLDTIILPRLKIADIFKKAPCLLHSTRMQSCKLRDFLGTGVQCGGSEKTIAKALYNKKWLSQSILPKHLVFCTVQEWMVYIHKKHVSIEFPSDN